MKRELSIIIPVYNEAENIPTLFEELTKNIKDINTEVIIVYDFDEDNTLPVIAELQNNYSFVIRLVKNMFGKGALNAIKTGFICANGQALLVVMADLSDDLSNIKKMYELIIKDKYDIVCASRYMKGGRQIGGPFLKSLISRTAGLSLHYLSGIPTHDVTNSFKMYSRRAIENIEIESNGGFEIGMEITVKAYKSGLKITEIPTEWRARKSGTSRFRMFKWIPKYLRWYFYSLNVPFFTRVGVKQTHKEGF